jgi:hypothetical protein
MVEISSMETTHLINSLGKAQREIFESQNKEECSQKLKIINDLKEEYHKRFNTYYENLKD